MAVVLFPSEPSRLGDVDQAFALEREAARAAGSVCHLVDHTLVTAGDAERAVAMVPEVGGPAIYRGWMLTAGQYAEMYEALARRSVRLINTPTAYSTCHHLPESYHLLCGKTPRSTWAPLDGPPSRELLRELAAPFGDGPIVIKDYVKSQKHYWNEACFIPDASDLDNVLRVVSRFLELQGDDLNVGLVFRELVPLEIAGTHPKSGMPLAAEVRIFWLDAKPLLVHRYWGDLVDIDPVVPLDELGALARSIPSRFFTMDVARLEDGSWTIVELGDGQVSGLPSTAVARPFYDALTKAVGLES